MNKRKTLLVVRQELIGLAIRRGRTASLFTCPQTATALGVSLRWVHRYVRGRKRGLLYSWGGPCCGGRRSATYIAGSLVVSGRLRANSRSIPR
jgi:hypothetical protein